MKITKEDFESWRDNHVTEQVFKACEVMSGVLRDAWLAHSWNAGGADPLLLAELRAKASVWEDVRTLSFEAIEEALDDESKRDKPD